MKKIFSLICLFVFMFFGLCNVVLASTTGEDALSIEQVKNRLQELLNSNEDVSIKEIVYQNNQLIIVSNSSSEADFAFNYDSDKKQLVYNGTQIPVRQANKYLIYLRALFKAVMLEHGFTTEEIDDVRNKTKGESASGHTIYNIDGLFYYEGTQYVDDASTKLVNFNYSISLSLDLKSEANNILQNENPEDSGDGEDDGDSDNPDGFDDFDGEDSSDSENNGETGDPENGGDSDDTGNTGGETDDSENNSTEETTEKPETNQNTSDLTIKNIIFIGGCLMLIAGYSVKRIKKIKKEGLN